jgi:hypothetical protein
MTVMAHPRHPGKDKPCPYHLGQPTLLQPRISLCLICLEALAVVGQRSYRPAAVNERWRNQGFISGSQRKRPARRALTEVLTG